MRSRPLLLLVILAAAVACGDGGGGETVGECEIHLESGLRSVSIAREDARHSELLSELGL